jgi:cell division protein FtsB
MITQDNVVMDRRVTRAFEWLSGIFASLLVVILVWVGKTLVEVRQSIAVMQIQAAPLPSRIDRLESKIEAMQAQSQRIETRVATMEARQLRNGGE